MVREKKKKTKQSKANQHETSFSMEHTRRCGIKRENTSYIIVFIKRLSLLLYVKYGGGTEKQKYDTKPHIKYTYFIVSLEFLAQCLHFSNA